MEQFIPTNNNSSEKSKSSEDLRQEISDLFMQELQKEKVAVEEDIKHIEGVFSDSTLEAHKGLMVFSRALQNIAKDTRIPEKERTFLRVHLMNLSPIGATEIFPGIDSYTLAVKSILETLDSLLTPEVSFAIHAYAKQIFLPPAQDYAENRNVD